MAVHPLEVQGRPEQQPNGRQAVSEAAQSSLLRLLEKMEKEQQLQSSSTQQLETLNALYDEARFEQQKMSLYTKEQAAALKKQVARMAALPNPIGIKDLLRSIHSSASDRVEDMGDMGEAAHRGVNAAQGTALGLSVIPAIAATPVGLPGAVIASMGLGFGSYAVMNKLTQLAGKIPLVGRLSERARRFGVTGGLLAGSLGITGLIGGSAAVLASLPLVGAVGGVTALVNWLQRRSNREQLQESLQKGSQEAANAAPTVALQGA